MSDLDLLRAQVQEVDRQLLQLAARRMELATEIGAEKRGRGLPLRDYDVERAVLERAAQTAAQVGVSSDLARAMLGLLIEESRVTQERHTYASYSGDAERIVIVGGLGKMGRWFAEFFRNQGHAVDPVDAGDAVAERVRDACAGGAGFVLIATPLHVVPETIASVVAHAGAAVVFDIASLKGHLKPQIEQARARGARVSSIHPMFGPGARTLSDKVICLCDCGDSEATQRVARLFSETAATLVPLSLEEHDRIAACVLGLSHLANLWITRVLRRSGMSCAALDRVGSTTFHSQMATTRTVARDNPQLYFEIQRLNPFTGALYAAAREELEAITREVESGAAEEFVAQMIASREWMDAS